MPLNVGVTDTFNVHIQLEIETSTLSEVVCVVQSTLLILQVHGSHIVSTEFSPLTSPPWRLFLSAFFCIRRQD